LRSNTDAYFLDSGGAQDLGAAIGPAPVGAFPLKITSSSMDCRRIDGDLRRLGQAGWLADGPEEGRF
jgi:hypothetical protein